MATNALTINNFVLNNFIPGNPRLADSGDYFDFDTSFNDDFTTDTQNDFGVPSISLGMYLPVGVDFNQIQTFEFSDFNLSMPVVNTTGLGQKHIFAISQFSLSAAVTPTPGIFQNHILSEFNSVTLGEIPVPIVTYNQIHHLDVIQPEFEPFEHTLARLGAYDILTQDFDLEGFIVGGFDIEQDHKFIFNETKFSFILPKLGPKLVHNFVDIPELQLRNPIVGRSKLIISNYVDKPKSVQIRDHLPQFFDFEQSKLTQFIQYYYEWMESVGPDYFSANIRNYNNIDSRKTGFDSFNDFLKNEFLKDFPNKMEIDQRFLIKHIKDFYRAKGSEDALRLLFKILYDDEIEVSYPGKYILRASHGKWLVEKSMKLTLLVGSIAEISEYDFIIGSVSKAEAKIQRIEQTILADKIIIEMYYDSQNGEFVTGEILKSKLNGNNIAIIQSMTTYPGRYTNTDGWLSSDMKLQDNYYYQEFSYVIKSGFPLTTYREQVKNLAHPAGTAMFGEFLLLVDVNNITDTSDIQRLFTKQIPYDINLFEFLQLSLTSEQTTGSYTGKYIIEYIFDGDIFDLYNDYVIENISLTGETIDQYTLKTINEFTDVEVDDVLEVYDEVKNTQFYLKVKDKISDSEIESYNRYPFGNLTDLTINKIDKPDNKIETMVYVNNAGPIVEDEIEIRAIDSYQHFKEFKFVDLKTVKVVDMYKKSFAFTETRNFENENAVHNSILSVKNNINNLETSHFIEKVHNPKLMQIKDEYPDIQSDDLNYQVVNI